VALKCSNRETYVAALAVNIVLSQSLAHTTDPAIIAMVNSLVRVIVPQFALRTEIPCGVFSTRNANIAGRLWSGAKHAQHVAGLFPVQGVRERQVVRLIVAMAARKPTLAVEALDFHVPLVVHAA
jgi:hypothetical protein